MKFEKGIAIVKVNAVRDLQHFNQSFGIKISPKAMKQIEECINSQDIYIHYGHGRVPFVRQIENIPGDDITLIKFQIVPKMFFGFDNRYLHIKLGGVNKKPISVKFSCEPPTDELIIHTLRQLVSCAEKFPRNAIKKEPKKGSSL